MLRINGKAWAIIEKNNLNNVQVFTNINTFNSTVTVVFHSSKDYMVFVRQFECKFGIGEGKLIPERLEVKSEW